MIEAKIILLMFVWPAGQAGDQPLWTSDAALTLERCEEQASQLRADMAARYGADARVQHFCVHADDRISK